MWNISVSGQKREIQDKIRSEIDKYSAVDYCDGQLNLIGPFVEGVIVNCADTDMIAVTSAGGDRPNLPASMVHTINVVVNP